MDPNDYNIVSYKETPAHNFRFPWRIFFPKAEIGGVRLEGDANKIHTYNICSLRTSPTHTRFRSLRSFSDIIQVVHIEIRYLINSKALMTFLHAILNTLRLIYSISTMLSSLVILMLGRNKVISIGLRKL